MAISGILSYKPRTILGCNSPDTSAEEERCRNMSSNATSPKWEMSRRNKSTHLTKSCSVLNKLGPQIQWLHSYVTQDKIDCVYIAPNEEMVQEHGRQGGFPANRVLEVKLVIDPTSAEA
jgi:hypothetical protein